MSTNATGALSSTDSTDTEETIEVSAEAFHDLVRRVDELEQQNGELHERVDELEEERGLIPALRKKINNLEEKLETYRKENEEDKADIRKYATEKAEEARSPTRDSGGEGVEDAPAPTPIERCFEDPNNSGVRVTASVQRAMRIVGNFDRWAKRAGTDGKLVVKDNLRTLLATAGGETVAWKQVYRACRKLEELSNGALRFKKHRRHGWMVILDDSDFLARVVSGR